MTESGVLGLDQRSETSASLEVSKNSSSIGTGTPACRLTAAAAVDRELGDQPVVDEGLTVDLEAHAGVGFHTEEIALGELRFLRCLSTRCGNCLVRSRDEGRPMSQLKLMISSILCTLFETWFFFKVVCGIGSVQTMKSIVWSHRRERSGVEYSLQRPRSSRYRTWKV